MKTNQVKLLLEKLLGCVTAYNYYTCKLWPKTPSEYNYHIQTQAQTKPSHKKKNKQVANLKFTTHCDKNYCHSVNILLLHVHTKSTLLNKAGQLPWLHLNQVDV